MLSQGDPTQAIGIGNFISMTGVSLSITDFTIDTSNSTNPISGTIGLNIASLSLFPNGNLLVQSNLQAVSGSYGFGGVTHAGKLTFNIGTFELQMGEALKLDASNVTLNPGQATLATIDTATITSPQFSSPVIRPAWCFISLSYTNRFHDRVGNNDIPVEHGITV